MTPWTCPVCQGRGFVPPGFYNSLGIASELKTEVCRTCLGKGAIWEPPCELKHISDDGLRRLGKLYCAIWGDACYDPMNESTRKFALDLLPDIKALNDELKFKE